jgi:2-iminobutanoate/2-iminopropanoate deaminase
MKASAMKEIIQTPNAPKAIGPYSQAVAYDGLVYCSGQIGLDPATMEFAGDTVDAQAEQVMKNLSAVLEAAGSGFDKVIKCTIFLADMGDFATVNAIYGRYFAENPPARETVAVKTLPKNGLVEIGCIAHR